jgi:hypothetical protein
LNGLDLRFQLVGWFMLARLGVEMVLDIESWDHAGKQVTV